MITQNLYVGKLISAINQYVTAKDEEGGNLEADICDWGEWMVSYAMDCVRENVTPDYYGKLLGIAGVDFAEIIMAEHGGDFKLIELNARLMQGHYFDYSITSLGISFIGH